MAITVLIGGESWIGDKTTGLPLDITTTPVEFLFTIPDAEEVNNLRRVELVGSAKFYVSSTEIAKASMKPLAANQPYVFRMSRNPFPLWIAADASIKLSYECITK